VTDDESGTRVEHACIVCDNGAQWQTLRWSRRKRRGDPGKRKQQRAKVRHRVCRETKTRQEASHKSKSEMRAGGRAKVLIKTRESQRGSTHAETIARWWARRLDQTETDSFLGTLGKQIFSSILKILIEIFLYWRETLGNQSTRWYSLVSFRD